MAGVGKLLKQAQRMQKKIESMQLEFDQREIEVSSGGGAVTLKVSVSGDFRELKLDPELLKEEPSLIEETILQAIREASSKAKEVNDEEMKKATEGLSFPGLM